MLLVARSATVRVERGCSPATGVLPALSIHKGNKRAGGRQPRRDGGRMAGGSGRDNRPLHDDVPSRRCGIASIIHGA
ncbi:MAG: hypothetical protein AVDCRST_MAG88-4315 [uncultured Thermomicrobiales bacterium]|uniref:Uncharacterized protein n=1 Tax=uncultured Thermomicrobiales bacterium TaxID=1645740 RepID=A0A6J4VYJ7_9BACT|nr:MAG: hypothetical protein AVDCRST_MAG88-4315 [uncultured Thermomicrobiales bacterium]